MNIADINTETRALVDASTTSYADPLLLIRTNTAILKVSDVILDADGRFDWDDSNNTDFPEGTANLVSGQKDYSIDTSYIEIVGASVLGSSGVWRKLLPFDPDDLASVYGPLMDRAQFLSSSGNPLYYDLHGNSIILYPAPDNGVSVTLAGGLKVYAKRTAQLFTSAEVSAGTKVPGFASQFHHIISYLAAEPYAQAYKPERVAFIQEEILRVMGDPDKGITGALARFYSKRNKDERQILSMKGIVFK